MAAILIIGEEPDSIRPEDLPPGITLEGIRKGLESSRDSLRAEGHEAEILYTTSAEKIAGDLAAAVRGKHYDVLVIGAGLRTLPPMLDHFERLVNAIREHARQAKLAFNSKPDDSAVAARRQIIQQAGRSGS